MAKKRTKIDSLVDQIIQSEVENRLAKLAKRTKRKAMKSSTELRQYLQLPYVQGNEIIEAEAEVIEPEAADSENASPTLKKTPFDG